MAYLVNLDRFYGPLDLLLYLIEKEEMDIYDIPIAEITAQYLVYIQDTGEMDLERLGSFLIMATYLLNLKSQMLLPSKRAEEAREEELSDPREELVNKLLEYKKYKLAAESLTSLLDEEAKRIYYRDGRYEVPSTSCFTASVDYLLKAFKSVMQANYDYEEYNLPQNDADVGEKMKEIIQRLEIGGSIIFQDFFKGVLSRREALAFFLALLELIRLQKVEALQDQSFGEISICMRVGI